MFSRKAAVEKGLYRGVNVGNDNFVFSHPQYGDDTIFFGELGNENMRSLLNLLKCFELASGLKINMRKSNRLGVGATNDEIVALANYIGCDMGSFPFKYFGLPIGSKMKKLGDWNGVLDKFKSTSFSELGIDFRSSFTRSVANDLGTGFWKDAWLCSERLEDKFKRLFRLDSDGNALVADRVDWSENGCRFKGQWNREPLGQALNELTLFTNMLHAYNRNSSGEDSWRWGLATNGKFTTKKLTQLLEE
ncbi:uncharacterized protein [Rutidosis leptorrhynchoides]|uniref:uncharacterized protein n=1 Tax=Rutidosis leptorrhynchoides TaxID=125765 RepID=UPI003A99BEB2